MVADSPESKGFLLGMLGHLQVWMALRLYLADKKKHLWKILTRARRNFHVLLGFISHN